MSIKEKLSNPSTILIIILAVSLATIFTTFLILQLNNKAVQIPIAEALEATPTIENIITTTEPTTVTRFTSKVPTPRPTSASTPKTPTICDSPECLTLSHQLSNFQDLTVDPCQDFYEASCGNYNEHSPFVSRQSRKMTTILQLIEDFLVRNESTTSKSENAVKLFYKKCSELKNSEDSEMLKRQSFRELLKDIQNIGSWPLLSKNWNQSEFDLNDVMNNMAKAGMTRFGFFEINAHDEAILEMSPLFEIRYRDFFNDVIEPILRANNISYNKKQIDDDVHNYLDFIEKVQNSTCNFNYPPMDINVLKTRVPMINFEKLIQSMISPNKMVKSWKKIQSKIIFRNCSIFMDDQRNLQKLLESTQKRTLANYLIFSFIENSMFAIESTTFHKSTCTEHVIKILPRESLRVYVRNYFDKENVKIMSGMIKETKELFIEMFKETKWLHEETRKNAILKVQKMKVMVGYPEEYEEKGALDKTFESLHLSESDSFYAVFKKIRKFLTEQMMDFVAQEIPINPTVSLMEVNAFYLNRENSLNFLVPYFDAPFFDSTFPKYVKIAGIGSIIAHEIGHGFDDMGRQFDEHGKRRQWWKREDWNEYNKREQCLVEQFENYDDPVYGKKLKGARKINEIIADNIGINIAWKFLKKLSVMEEQTILGFGNYSTDKLFFRLYSLTRCSIREKSSLSSVSERSHPPNNFRVNGLFSNMNSFSETFNCPIGTQMNPQKKCQLFI